MKTFSVSQGRDYWGLDINIVPLFLGFINQKSTPDFNITPNHPISS
jgi:hypothetical protein